MPVITFPYAVLESMLAKAGPRGAPARTDVTESLFEFGCAPEGAADGAELSVECLMNRPDLFSAEGVARALAPFMRLGAAPTYAPADGPVELTVAPEVLPVRPSIAAAVVRGVDLDEAGLKRLIDTQEKLDFTYGRRRTRVSIGLHDLAPLKPPIMYTAHDPDTFSFEPLVAEGQGGPRGKQTMRQILAGHPKGREYGHILEGARAFPLLIDSAGTVLSMPPIINGVATAVKPGRRDLFLDVTGTSDAPVAAATRLLAMVLADRGGRIQRVAIKRPDRGPCAEPDLSYTPRTVSVQRAAGLIGVKLHADEAAGALERMGHRARIAEKGARIDVEVPPWRSDILHEVDLVEDIAIGLGYRAVPSALPRLPTIGQEGALASLGRRLRSALLGLGYTEVMTLTLRSEADAALEPTDLAAPATVSNPITADHSVLRRRLLPSLLRVLAANTHRDLPQAAFEVADVVVGPHNEARVAAVYLGADASFTRAKSACLAVLESLGLPLEVAPARAAPFLEGRCAAAAARGVPLGHLGEVAPAVLANLGLDHPACAFELSLPALTQAAAPAAAPG